LEGALEGAVETLGGIAVVLAKFNYDLQDSLYTKVNELVGDLAAVDRAAQSVEASVPVDILGAIDRGRNPVQMTYRHLEDVAKSSVSAKAKLSAMEDFRTALNVALAAPDDSTPAESSSVPAKSGGGDPTNVKPANGMPAI